MPHARSDRQAWEDELRELRAALTHLRHEVAATPEENREHRETLAVKFKLAEASSQSPRQAGAPTGRLSADAAPKERT